MKKKVAILVVNWIEVALLFIINYNLNLEFYVHFFILTYAFMRFIHGILEVKYLVQKTEN